MTFIRRILSLMKRELRLMTYDIKLPVVTLLFPTLFALLFGYIYIPKHVTGVPTWIIDQDHSQLSRSIRDAVKSSNTFRVVREGGTEEEFQEANRLDQAYACYWIPPHFERDVKHGKPVRLLGIVDGSNFLIMNSAYRTMTEIGLTYSTGVQMKRLSMRGTPSTSTQGAAFPVRPTNLTWYNPTFNYLNFLLPGLLCLVIQQVGVVAVALAFTREQELGLLPEILDITDSPLEILFSKTLFYFIANMIGAPPAFLVASRFFGIDMKGLPLVFTVLLPVFLLAVISLGLCFSAFIPSQVTATQILMLLAAPSFLMSGYTWPQMSMIPWMRVVSELQPISHFSLSVRQLCLQGGDLASIRPHLLWLWGAAALGFAVAYLGVRLALGRIKKEEPFLSPSLAVTATS